MSDLELAQEFFAEIHEAMKAVRGLMESEDQDVRVFALDTFTKLGEMAMVLMGALGEKKHSEERNPLSRRAQIS